MRTGSRRRIWVDTDIALGGSRGDVDDGFALAAVALAAQRWPERYELLGVSAVTGNTASGIALDCARELLDRAGPSCAAVPVVPQAQAAAALAGLPPGASLLALGPLSNLLQAARQDPGLPARIEIRAVGTVLKGSRHPWLRYFCLNFRHDRAAAHWFFGAAFQSKKIFPLDVVRRLNFGASDLTRIEACGDLGRYLAQHSRRWLRQSWWRYQSPRFPVWDLVAALDAVGLLMDARWTADGRLQEFAPDAALEDFMGLLESPHADAPRAETQVIEEHPVD